MHVCLPRNMLEWITADDNNSLWGKKNICIIIRIYPSINDISNLRLLATSGKFLSCLTNVVEDMNRLIRPMGISTVIGFEKCWHVYWLHPVFVFFFVWRWIYRYNSRRFNEIDVQSQCWHRFNLLSCMRVYGDGVEPVSSVVLYWEVRERDR